MKEEKDPQYQENRSDQQRSKQQEQDTINIIGMTPLKASMLIDTLKNHRSVRQHSRSRRRNKTHGSGH